MKTLLWSSAFAIALGLGTPLTAHAVSPYAIQRVYFNEQGEIVGESFRYCNNNTSHWGSAPRSSNAFAQASYKCEEQSTTIGFMAGVPEQARRTLCQITDVCTQPMPWPSYQYVVGPITPSMYSD